MIGHPQNALCFEIKASGPLVEEPHSGNAILRAAVKQNLISVTFQPLDLCGLITAIFYFLTPGSQILGIFLDI